MSPKKILCSLLISSMVAGFIPNAFAVNPVDFNVKIATAGDNTYTTSLSNVSNANTDVTFQFVEISAGWAEEYSVNIPTGFTYQSSNNTGNTCAGFSFISTTDSTFHFSFNGAANCIAKTEFTYRITSAAVAGTQPISLLLKNGLTWSALSNVTLGVTSANTITKAITLDLNSNGYIDAYKLSFTNSATVTANTLSWVTVAGSGITRSAAYASGTNWIIPFTDSVLWTGDLPQIGGVFDGIVLANSSINEEDGAWPQIMKINGTALTGQLVSIGTGAFDVDFSEKMATASVNAFSLTMLNTTPVAGGFVFNASLDRLTFTPSSPFSSGIYTLSSTTGATDWSLNGNALSQTFYNLIVSDIVAPVGGTLGTGTGIIINAGNSITNNPSVQLGLLASDANGVANMMVSNSASFSGAAWESYATTKTNWSLDTTTGTGTKTVYVKFRDFAGNTSAVYSDTIIYDNALSYVSFASTSTISTPATSIALSGSCNYVSSTGVVLSSLLDTFVGTTNIGTVSCIGNHWSQTFTGLAYNSINTLKVAYTSLPSLNATISVTNTTIPVCSSVANATITGAFPACTFTCNAGYALSGGACIAISTWGGGGGWGSSSSYTYPDTCPAGDKSWNLYDGKCDAPWSGTGTTGTGGSVSGTGSNIPRAPWIPEILESPSLLSSSTIDARYFSLLKDAQSYLLTNISHPAIVRLINSYKDKLSIQDEAYFLSIDRDFYVTYNRIVNAYALLFMRVQDAVSGNRSEAVKSDGRFSVGVVTSGVAFAKDFLDKYVTREYISEKNITLYRTKNALLTKPLSVLEKKVIDKFDALLTSETITLAEYNASVQAYDDFVLHLSIYRDYSKNALVKERALRAISIFTATYAKTVVQKAPSVLAPVQPSPLGTISVPKKIGEIYTFSRDLKFGDMNQDVTNLQTILKSYGYFGTFNPTGYFGLSTKSYLIKFSKEVLGITNLEGIFDTKIREAIVKIEVR